MEPTFSWPAAWTVLAVVVTVLVFRFVLIATKQPTSLTATNTLLNAATHSDLSRRRIASRLALWQNEDGSEEVYDPNLVCTFKSRPIPDSVKPCLKRRTLTPAPGSAPLSPEDETPASTAGSSSVTPSTAGTAAATLASGGSTGAGRKSVRVIEPDKEELEELRAFWRNVGGPKAYGGIGGYRPTSLFAKSKSGGGGPAAATVPPRTVIRVGVPLTPGESDKEESEKEKDERDDDSDDSSDDTKLPTAIDTPTPVGRPSIPRLAVPVPARNSSLSPTRAGKVRASSPSSSFPTTTGRSGSPAFVASRPGVKRRNHSSSPAPAERSTSPNPPPEAAQPKWVKNKKGKGVAVQEPVAAAAPTAAANGDGTAQVGEQRRKDKGKAQAVNSDSDESSGYEDVTSADVSRQNSPERERRPTVSVTAPSLATTSTPPVTTATKLTRPAPATPAAPSAPNGTRLSSSSPTLPVRTSSINHSHLAEAKPTRMLGGRKVSFAEESHPHTMVA